MIRLFAYVWTLPNTAIGLLVAAPCLAFGGKARWVSGVVEVDGPLLRYLLRGGVPIIGNAMAITLGHVVLGCSAAALDVSRPHERVHVAQYERWGPAFIPAYLISSLWALLRGADPYRDNRFERQAYQNAKPLL